MSICRVLLIAVAVAAGAPQNDFVEQWIEYLKQLNDQTITASSDFPIDARILSTLQKCPKYELNPFASADNLAPSDIEIFSEIGHLGVFCDDTTEPHLAHWLDTERNRSILNGYLTHDVAESCTKSLNPLPTLDDFLAVFNPSLTVIASERATNIISQTRRVISVVKSLKNWKERWKLIVVAPSPYDSELHSLDVMATAVLEVLGELFRVIPHRTLVVVVRVSETKIWQQASFGFEACERLLSKWKLHDEKTLVNVWDTLEEHIAYLYRYPTFSAQILPFMRNALLLPYNDTIDVSPLGADCVHLSTRGHSLLHQQIWNSLFTRPTERPNFWRPLVQPLVCPPPHCPYIATSNNTVFCVEPDNERNPPDPTFNEDLLVVILLLFTILLCIILLGVIIVDRTPMLFRRRFGGEESSYVNYMQPDEV